MEISNKKTLIYERLSAFVVIALGFLMPVFFLTTTTEFFEFNKLALLAIVTFLLVVLLGAKVLTGSSIHFLKSTLDVPLFIYIVLFFIATLFSIDKTSSIWGSQGRWFPSLFGLVVLTLFYYLAAPSFKDARSVKMALYALIAGVTVSTLVAIVRYFGISIGPDAFFQNPTFNLTGSVTSTIILAAVASVLALYFTYRESFIPAKVLLLTATFANFVYIAITGTLMGWVLFVLGLGLTISALGVSEMVKDRFSTMFLTTALVLITLLNVFPATKTLLSNSNYPMEIVLPIKSSWVVSTAAIQDYPLLATGPSTFYLNYSRYRPLTMNATPLWNIRFDKPYNEVFNVLGTLGILGLAAFLLLGVKIFRFALANFGSDEGSGVTKALGIAVIMSFSVYLFTYATVLNTFLLFFLLALLTAAHVSLVQSKRMGELVSLSFTSFAAATTTIGETSALRREYANVVAVTPFVIAALFGVYLFGRTYLGEYYMRQAIVAAVANQAPQAYDFQGRAINLNPRRDAYHTSYAQTNLVLANALAARQNLTDQDKQTIQTLVSQAIRSTRVSTEVVNSLNVSNWETRALIYRALINVADNAADWAIGAYNTAIQLDPTNPALRIDLGGVYYARGDFLSAANMFRQASVLKADYANAHYNFAQALLNLNDIENAKRELETTRSLVPAGSEDWNLVGQQIASLDSQQAAVAGAATEQKPTVEQIVGQEPTATPQEPLTTPEQQQQQLNEGALPIIQQP